MDVLQIVAEPTRREIIRLVWDDEMSAGDIASRFDITFGAVSQHLSRLREAGLVEMRRDGNMRIYRADRDALEPFRQILEMAWAGTLQKLADTIEHYEDR